MLQITVLLVAALAALASAGIVKPEDCGSADLPIGKDFVLRIDGVEDGAEDVVLIKGQTYSLEMDFVADAASPTLENKLFGEIIGIPVPWNGVDADACPSLASPTCPLEKGTKYGYKNSLTVAESYPSISLKIIWKLVDADGNNEVCFKLPAKIQSA